MKYKAVKQALKAQGYYLKRKHGYFVICEEGETFEYGELRFDAEGNWDSFMLKSSTAFEVEMTEHLNEILFNLWQQNI